MTTRGLSGELRQAEAVEKLQLLWDGGENVVWRSFTNFRLAPLDPSQKFECGARAGTMAVGLRPHAHDPVENKGKETDQGVASDPVRQAMVNRPDLDVDLKTRKLRSISLKAL